MMNKHVDYLKCDITNNQAVILIFDIHWID